MRTDAPSESSDIPYLDDAQKNLYTFAKVFKEKFNGRFDYPKLWAGVSRNKGESVWYKKKEYQVRWVPNYAWGSEGGSKTNIAFSTTYVDKSKTDSGKYEIQCGAISSIGLKEFKYGYFEARMYMPENKKHWGAFWLMPGKEHIESMAWNTTADGGSDGAEIDIAEGNKQNSYSSGIHIDGYKDGVEASAGGEYTSNGTGKWRVYGVLWTATELKFYCDGVLKYNFKDKITGLSSPYNTIDYWIPDVEQCIRLNSDAIPTDNSSWLAGTWSDTNNRDQLRVDWVKVYSVVKK